MAGRLSQTASIQEEVIKALLVNAPAVMDIAEQLELTPREVRNILQESLLQIDGVDPYVNDVIPIVAKPSPAFPILSAEEKQMLVGGGRSGGQ